MSVSDKVIDLLIFMVVAIAVWELARMHQKAADQKKREHTGQSKQIRKEIQEAKAREETDWAYSGDMGMVRFTKKTPFDPNEDGERIYKESIQAQWIHTHMPHLVVEHTTFENWWRYVVIKLTEQHEDRDLAWVAYGKLHAMLTYEEWQCLGVDEFRDLNKSIIYRLEADQKMILTKLYSHNVVIHPRRY